MLFQPNFQSSAFFFGWCADHVFRGEIGACAERGFAGVVGFAGRLGGGHGFGRCSVCGTWAGALQAPLLALLNDPQCSVRLNARPYILVSYPWSIRYQQSNHWALETLASALEPGITHREQALA